MILTATLASGCATAVSEASTSESTSSPTGTPVLDLVCSGEGQPLLVLLPGLGGDARSMDAVRSQLDATTRVCSVSRAGLGASPPWPDDAPDPSPGRAADQLADALDAAGLGGPAVVLGWSYGGMVAQAFAARHEDRLVGLVLEDSSVIAQFIETPAVIPDFVEAGRQIDHVAAIEELEDLDLGTLPTVVVTQGEASDFREWWQEVQRDLASRSADALHLVALESGHEIHRDALPLLVAAIELLIESERSDVALPECDPDRWLPVGGACA